MKDLNLSQIADILVFSDLSTFSQAYKRWIGFAPNHYKIKIISNKKSSPSESFYTNSNIHIIIDCMSCAS